MSGIRMPSWWFDLILGAFVALGCFFLLAERPRDAYRRGWCNAQNARYVGNGWCVSTDGRAFETPGGGR